MAHTLYDGLLTTGFLDNDLPQSDDPIWAKFGSEVLDELETPKTVKQLKSWARGEKFQIGKLFNTLAWLNMQGLVLLDKTAGAPIWKRTDALSPTPPALVAAPKYCERCEGRMKAEPTRFACVTCGHSVYPPPDPNEPDDAMEE